MSFTMLKRIDTREIPDRPAEVRAFVAVRNEMPRLECFLAHYRRLGVGRFFFADNLSKDGTVEYLLRQRDCHVFSASGNYFEENVEPPEWTNSLANAFGDGHWCLTIDADELLVYPHCEEIGLVEFCRYIEDTGAGAVAATMVDMYAEGPVAQTRHRPGSHFLEACSHFDGKPGWMIAVEPCPGWQMFGGVRERVFWRDRFRAQLPPCISKVPLVRWHRGMRYLVSMHLHSGASVSPIRAGLLHFKFLAGFAGTASEQVDANQSVAEKGLGEKAIMVSAIASDPDLTLFGDVSRKYEGPESLVETGWMVTSDGYERYARQRRRTSRRGKSRISTKSEKNRRVP